MGNESVARQCAIERFLGVRRVRGEERSEKNQIRSLKRDNERGIRKKDGDMERASRSTTPSFL